MSGRGELPCNRCQELKRRDKLVQVKDTFGNFFYCKHCRSVLVYKLKQLEEIALLADD